MIMVSCCWKMNCPHTEAKIISVLLMMSLKLTIKVVAFFLGHTVYITNKPEKSLHDRSAKRYSLICHMTPMLLFLCLISFTNINIFHKLSVQRHTIPSRASITKCASIGYEAATVCKGSCRYSASAVICRQRNKTKMIQIMQLKDIV